MNPKLISILQKTFTVFGWLVLLVTALSLITEPFYHFKVANNPFSSIIGPTRHFDLIAQLRALLTGVGQGFFLLLLSAVFGMIFHRAPIRLSHANKLLNLCCLGFAGDGVLAILRYLATLPETFDSFQNSFFFGVNSLLTHMSFAFSGLTNLVWAIAIYILFRHFSAMITFESEVV